jgi:hypothetical protein
MLSITISIMLNVNMLSGIMLGVIILSVTISIKLSVIMLNSIMLCVLYAEHHNFHYDECHYVDCH